MNGRLWEGVKMVFQPGKKISGIFDIAKLMLEKSGEVGQKHSLAGSGSGGRSMSTSTDGLAEIAPGISHWRSKHRSVSSSSWSDPPSSLDGS